MSTGQPVLRVPTGDSYDEETRGDRHQQSCWSNVEGASTRSGCDMNTSTNQS
jgi:hypothetical protein